MEFIPLNHIAQLDQIDKESIDAPVLLFKHSTRCSISSAALARMKKGWLNKATIKSYYLDLLTHRDISNEIAARYSIEHQSPQVLLIDKGKCVYTESHLAIQPSAILEQLSQ
jgi:bacillithiol system protein YtxJ